MNPLSWRKWKIRKRINELKGTEEFPEHREVPEVPGGMEPGVDGVPLDDSYARHLRDCRDAIISGPLGEGRQGARGRWFNTVEEALHWAADKYGADRVKLIDYEGASRWAILVKKLKP